MVFDPKAWNPRLFTPGKFFRHAYPGVERLVSLANISQGPNTLAYFAAASVSVEKEVVRHWHQSKRDQVRRILQLPPPAITTEDKELNKLEQVF